MRRLFLAIAFIAVCAINVSAQLNQTDIRLRGMSAPGVSPSGQAWIYFDSSTNKVKISENGGDYVNLVGGGGGSTDPGGSNTQIQFNDSGVFGGDAGLVYDKTTNFLTVAGGGVTLSSSTINKLTLTPPATGATFTLGDGKTATISNTLTIAGTDGSTLNVGTGGTLGTGAFAAQGATRALDNLSSVAINTALLPATDASIALGSGSKEWTNVFLSGQVKFNGIGGDAVGYTNGVGPTFPDSTTGFVLRFNTQSLSTDRIVVWPDAAGTVALTANKLSVFAATTSAELFSFISNETGGGGLLVGNSSPTIITPSFTTGFTIAGAATSRKIVVGNGTNFVASTETYAVPGTSGNVMTSDGTNWTSAAPAGGGNPFDDGTAIIKGSGDATKLLRFEVDAFTAGTTRVITPPDSNTSLPIYGATITYTGPTAARTVTYPDANFTVARTDAAQAFTGNQTFAGDLILANGANSTNLKSASGDDMFIWSRNSLGIRLGSSQFGTRSSLGLSSTNNPSSTDTYLTSVAAATLQVGQGDAASPVAQIVKAQSVIAGTSNTAGASSLDIVGSLGTSTGVPGRVGLKAGALLSTSGTTQQTAIYRSIIGASKVLANNTTTTVTNVSVASNTASGGVLDYTVEVSDGTDLQVETGSVSFMVTNKGGVFSGNTTSKFGNQQNATTGTLAVTFTITGANPALLQVNANSSLTPSSGYPRLVYAIRNQSASNDIAVQ